jgi:hypothetical protein
MKKQLTILIASGALALAFVAAPVQWSDGGISVDSAMAAGSGGPGSGPGGGPGGGGSGGSGGGGSGGK